ncbi:MAG: hypothetical protein A2017_09235 [Lentisphaerae bacterium GWF2_44_16]|nr:MAG: hypothetical protein A2017_09235 [Lentisphaerae bacterium GWF2_44_16]
MQENNKNTKFNSEALKSLVNEMIPVIADILRGSSGGVTETSLALELQKVDKTSCFYPYNLLRMLKTISTPVADKYISEIYTLTGGDNMKTNDNSKTQTAGEAMSTVNQNPMAETATGYQAVPVENLLSHPEASKLFVIEPELLNSISAEMKEKGFKGDRPISAVRDSAGKLFVYDGNTRLKAAIEAGLCKVPVYVNEDLDATDSSGIIREAVKDQTKRRQNSPATLLIAVEALYEKESILAKERMDRNPASIDATPPGKASEKIAGILGISASTVERLLKASKDPEIRKALLENVYDSINAAHEAAKAKDKAAALKVAPSEKTVPVPIESANNELPDIIIDCAETEGQEPTNEDEPIDAEISPGAITYAIYLSPSVARNILHLIADDKLDELKAIGMEAHSEDLNKLIAERTRHEA